jgi:hypothetical protein
MRKAAAASQAAAAATTAAAAAGVGGKTAWSTAPAAAAAAGGGGGRGSGGRGGGGGLASTGSRGRGRGGRGRGRASHSSSSKPNVVDLAGSTTEISDASAAMVDGADTDTSNGGAGGGGLHHRGSAAVAAAAQKTDRARGGGGRDSSSGGGAAAADGRGGAHVGAQGSRPRRVRAAAATAAAGAEDHQVSQAQQPGVRDLLSWLRSASLALAGPLEEQPAVTAAHEEAARRFRGLATRLALVRCRQLPRSDYPVFGAPAERRSGRVRTQAIQYQPGSRCGEAHQTDDGSVCYCHCYCHIALSCRVFLCCIVCYFLTRTKFVGLAVHVQKLYNA